MKTIPVRKFSTHHGQASSESLTIRKLQSLLNGKDFVQELHRHDFFFLLVLEKGKGSHEIDFVTYQVQNNSIFFLRPGQVHQLKLRAGSAGYVLTIKVDFFSSLDKSSDRLLRKASTNTSSQIKAPQFKKLVSVLNSVFTEYSEKKEDYKAALNANMQLFLIELMRQRRNESPSKKENMYQQERLEEFLSLVETHMQTHKQVRQYADMLNLSAFQLNSITKSMLGKTSSEVIDEHLLLEAKRELLATSNQVSQIADHLGFDDVSYFIRFFKRHTGYSPEAFRVNFR